VAGLAEAERELGLDIPEQAIAQLREHLEVDENDSSGCAEHERAPATT